MKDADQILLENIVTEVIVEPYAYEWGDQTEKWWNGYFKTENGTGIKVSITKQFGANLWEILFSTDNVDKSDPEYAYIRQDTGNPFKVFKTVHIMLDEFKDGAFRLAINHQIPIVPITFADNKERFSYTFFSGGPGKMRVKVHTFISTEGLKIDDTRSLNDRSKAIILKQLQQFNNKF